MTIGERIKILRKQKRMSAEDLAKEVKLSPSTIYRYENGDITSVNVNVLGPIAWALGTTLNYLLGETEDPSPLYLERKYIAAKEGIDIKGNLVSCTDEEKRLLNAYNAAKKIYRELAIELLEAHPEKR